MREYLKLAYRGQQVDDKKPTGEGTGLGLSLSYEIVTKAHQEQLHLESKEGEGTEIITLPAHTTIDN